jgi:hypothetical protein
MAGGAKLNRRNSNSDHGRCLGGLPATSTRLATLESQTKFYYEQRLAAILKSWPGMEKLDLSKSQKPTLAAAQANHALRNFYS